MYGIQQNYCTFLKHTEESATEQLAKSSYTESFNFQTLLWHSSTCATELKVKCKNRRKTSAEIRPLPLKYLFRLQKKKQNETLSAKVGSKRDYSRLEAALKLFKDYSISQCTLSHFRCSGYAKAFRDFMLGWN